MKHDGDVDELASNRQLDSDSSHFTKGRGRSCLNDAYNQGIEDVEMTDDIVVARTQRLLCQRGLLYETQNVEHILVPVDYVC